jgi:hypothetical protein
VCRTSEMTHVLLKVITVICAVLYDENCLPVICVETELYKAVVRKIRCLSRAFFMHICSSKGLLVILSNTHPRFFVCSCQDDFIWSLNPDFVSIPLFFIKVKWCCLDVIGAIH